ncbi:uncharacterized protein LOC128959927 [Oppia nitens]|uniref:uncharacterized protein LOC128959927 n=1 Tax=Oppia nitens TaxID=1686743 RepID=UPI0023DBE3D8|nr:uncharacterized protein LOC128959927 [Oppia nitens]
MKVLIILLLIILFLSSHCPTQRFILRNSQQLIYPVMRQLRLWTLPVMRHNKHLIGWDVEECIVENPFYGSVGLDCWPCDRVFKASDLTDFPLLAKEYVNNEKPFIIKDIIINEITAKTLVDTYLANREPLEFGTTRLVSNCDTKQMDSLKDMMSLLSNSLNVNNKSLDNVFVQKPDIHVEWKVNRVEAIRVIRKLSVRPNFVPNSSEVALQRFVFISGPKSPKFSMPKTEFANVWLTQGSGYRLIVLKPSPMCANNCTTFSVILKPKDTLYYNWQFYRPVAMPATVTNSNQLSITFVTSFY